MLANPVVKVFLTQPIQNVSASTLSSLVSVLKEDALQLSSGDGSVADDGTICEILRRLVSIANDGTKNTTLRSMVLECLYWISHHASDAIRQGPLLDSTMELNESFEAMLEPEDDALELQYRMLSVLLLRVSGYEQLKVGDLLENLYHGDARRVLRLLHQLLEEPGCEWPLCQAAARWLFELTTPISYFDAARSAGRVTGVEVFQGKLSALLEYGVEKHIFGAICAAIVELWRRSWAVGSDTVFGSCSDPSNASVFSSNQLTKLAQWATLLHYVSATIENLSQYCSKQHLVKSLQQSFLGECQGFLAEVAIPFTMAAIQTWRYNNVSGSEDLGDSSQSKVHPMLRAAIEVLQFLRLATYKPLANVPLSEAFLGALKRLGEYITQRESLLSRDYGGVLVLLLTVELLCNINARRQPALSIVFESLLAAIAADESPSGRVMGMPFANAFIAHFSGEASSYVDTQNESVGLVHSMLSKHEKENAELGEAVAALEEQLGIVQMAIMQLTLGQALEGFMQVLTAQQLLQQGDPPTRTNERNPYSVGRNILPYHAHSDHHSNKKTSKAKHPAKYCCQMTGKLMREPVTLKSGHHFEFDALKGVIDEIGHVNPLTGETIDEEVEVNEILQQEISKYRVKHAAQLE